MKLSKIWQIILIALFLVIGLFILDKYLALRGVLELSYDFLQKPTLISEITPRGRASERLQNLTTKETYQSLSGDPVYFSAEVPRSFDNVEVTLKYSNPAQKLIELGLNKSADWSFELKPIENKLIDDSTWEKLTQDEIILLQKNKTFNSVDEFLNNLPIDQRILTYNYQLPYTYKLTNYSPTDQEAIIEQDLRGSHEFYTYIKDEDLDFTFTYQDINAWFNRDDFKVEVYSGASKIHSDFVADDGIEIASGEVSVEQEKNILLTDLPEGLYKISLPITDDIVVNQIKTKQHKLVIKNNLFLAQQEGLTQLYTDSDEFLFKTDHSENLQTITVKNEEVVLAEAGKWAEYKDEDEVLDDLKYLSIPQNDVLIRGAGYYSFDSANYFDPDYLIDTLKYDTEVDYYDYIITSNYNAPEEESRYQLSTQTFSLDQVPGDRKTLDFLISLPGLEDINDDVVIKEIKLKFTRPSIWQKFRN